MPHLGELERAVMAVLWAAPEPVTAKAVGEALGDRALGDRTLAVTTVLTVLSRLERKGMVRRRRDDRAHTYAPVASREAYVAELMREALGTADNPDAALASFVGGASEDELDVLRRALRDQAATVIAVSLAGLAVVLAWPVPARLARSRRALRHPVQALVAWQVLGLATGLAAIGAGIAHGLRSPHWTGPVALGGALVFAAYLLGVAARVGLRTLRHRRRHRMVLDLVARPLLAIPGARLLDSPTAMAYCLPGLRPRVVVTSAALATLSEPALHAVVAHESAHLAQRHDLVVLPFVAWQAALPFLPGARTARAAVALLVEMLADDAARDRIGVRPLSEALVAVGLAGSSDYVAAPSIEFRLARL